MNTTPHGKSIVGSEMRAESLSFGAWRCQIIRADGTVRMSVLCPERDYDRPEQAERTARDWFAWQRGDLVRFGASPLTEPGESVRLQYRAPGKSRFVSVAP